MAQRTSESLHTGHPRPGVGPPTRPISGSMVLRYGGEVHAKDEHCEGLDMLRPRILRRPHRHQDKIDGSGDETYGRLACGRLHAPEGCPKREHSGRDELALPVIQGLPVEERWGKPQGMRGPGISSSWETNSRTEEQSGLIPSLSSEFTSVYSKAKKLCGASLLPACLDA